MNISYKNLLEDEPDVCCENRQPYYFLTERHLQAIWFEQKYFKPLQTSSGQAIEVVSPGIWNAEPGPDFKKAHLKIDGKDTYGDVEIHFSDENWVQHHHHLDERYNQVILHIALWKPANPKEILTKSGKSVTLVYLEEFLTVSHSRLLQLIDLDLYPYKKFLGSGKCAHAIFRSLPETQTEQFFKEAAQWRLEQKRLFLKAKTSEETCELGLGIAKALGYKHNSEAFLEIYLWLQQYREHPQETLFALTLGTCGFFEERFQKKWQDSEHYQLLFSSFKNLDFELKKFNLVLSQVRPINHPIRRLFFLTKLVKDQTLPSLQKKMLAYWKHNWRKIEGKNNRIMNELKEMLPQYQDEYWNHHYTFETTPKSSFLTLMGEDFKKEILVNAFLPLLQEEIAQRLDSEETLFFHEFYASLPATNTSKTKYLIHRFFGDSPKGNILKNSMTEQGAYQLHHDFCIHYEASCEGCPFIINFKRVCKKSMPDV